MAEKRARNKIACNTTEPSVSQPPHSFFIHELSKLQVHFIQMNPKENIFSTREAQLIHGHVLF